MFKCQPGYTLRKIKGINYLLPYGQQIADLKKGFVLKYFPVECTSAS